MNWILLAVATLQPLGTFSTRVSCELEIKQLIRNENPLPYYRSLEQEENYKTAIDGLYSGQKDYLCVRNTPQKKVDK